MADVSTPNSEYNEMACRWDPIDDLLGGTVSMRKAGEKWLPMEKKETFDEYTRRLNRSILYGAFADTLKKLAAKPFSRQVTVRGKLHPLIQPIIDNADRAGTSLHDVAKESFIDASARGLSHFLVDPPRNRGDETLKEVQDLELYPAIVSIHAEDLIGWKSEKDSRGMRRLTEIRILECEEEETDTYETKEVERVRVIRAGARNADGSTTNATWQIFEKKESTTADAWVAVESGEYAYTEIPLVTWYTAKCGHMEARPPLEELIWENISHWQSASDQKNILRFARIFQLAGTGMTEDDMAKATVAAANRMLHATQPDARYYVVETNGEAIKAGREDLQDIERRMETLGLQPFVERTADSTATGVMAHEGGQITILQSWIQSCERALLQAIRIAHGMMNVTSEVAPLDPELAVDIFHDFHSATAPATDLDTLTKARGAGDLDRGTYLEELQRRAVIAEDRKIKDILAAVEAEGPSASSFTLGGGMFGGAPSGQPKAPPNPGQQADPAKSTPEGAQQAAA